MFDITHVVIVIIVFMHYLHERVYRKSVEDQ